MRRRILLPTDFSNNSIQAINYARELYKNDDCDFYILNVFSATSNILDSLLNMEPGSELYETAKSDSENGLARVYDMISMNDFQNSKHHFEVISTFNNVIEAIKLMVDKKDIDMVVMGTKGASDSDKNVFGSTAMFVMEKVRNCPIIVVPKHAKINSPKEIVFPTNFKTYYKRRELNYLIDIAKNSKSTLVVLHISEENELNEIQEENKELLEDILKGTSYIFKTLSHNSVETAIDLFVESRDSDMVAFINRKHAFFGSILSNPLVKGITYHLKVPILAMHDLKN